MLKSIFSILLLLIALTSFGQEESVEPEKEPLLYDAKIGFNVIRAGQTFLGSGEDSQEFQLALSSKKYDYVLDLGSENNDRIGSYSYLNEGTYFRFGLDRNFVKNRESGNSLSLGLRYARSSFKDRLIYSNDNGFGQQEISLANPDLQARWMELVFNLRGKVVSNLYMGFTLRWKFARAIKGEDTLKAFDIPGFGTTKRQNATAFDYYLMWRIPFK